MQKPESLKPVEYTHMRIGQRVVFAYESPERRDARFYEGLLSPNSRGWADGPDSPGPAYLCCIHPSREFWLQNPHDPLDESGERVLVPLSQVYEHSESTREDPGYLDPETVRADQLVSLIFAGQRFNAFVRDFDADDGGRRFALLTPLTSFWDECPRCNSVAVVTVPLDRLLPRVDSSASDPVGDGGVFAVTKLGETAADFYVYVGGDPRVGARKNASRLVWQKSVAFRATDRPSYSLEFHAATREQNEVAERHLRTARRDP